MYMVEGHTHWFTSISQSIYWTIVTITIWMRHSAIDAEAGSERL